MPSLYTKETKETKNFVLHCQTTKMGPNHLAGKRLLRKDGPLPWQPLISCKKRGVTRRDATAIKRGGRLSQGRIWIQPPTLVPCGEREKISGGCIKMHPRPNPAARRDEEIEKIHATCKNCQA